MSVDQRVFCPMVDETIVLLMYQDYGTYDATYDALKVLYTDAEIQAAVASDDTGSVISRPSGSGSYGYWDGSTQNGGSSSSSTSTSNWDNVEDMGVEALKNMFPDIAPFTVEHTHKKCDGNMERVMDELLNLQMLSLDGEIAKGVDGFENENAGASGKKRNKKGRQRQNLKLQLDYKATNGIEEEQFEQSNDRQGSTMRYSAVAATPSATTPNRLISPTSPTPTAWNNVHKKRLDSQSRTSPTTDAHYCATKATSLHLAAHNEFMKAQQAHKRANRQNMLGAAAVVYAENGHRLNQMSHEWSSEAQRIMVEKNTQRHGGNNPNLLDLHGATVRIAKEMVKERLALWWGNVTSLDQARKAPFVIITGMGNNSDGGRPVLLPEVSKMLTRENWSFRVEGGTITVWGAKGAANKRALAPR